MDVTLSELLAAFMESPLVLWVSGGCVPLYFLFPVSGAGAFVTSSQRLAAASKQQPHSLQKHTTLQWLSGAFLAFIDPVQACTDRGKALSCESFTFSGPLRDFGCCLWDFPYLLIKLTVKAEMLSFLCFTAHRWCTSSVGLLVLLCAQIWHSPPTILSLILWH